MDEYIIGQQVRLEGSFTIANNNPPPDRVGADPSDIYLQLRHTSDAVTTVSLHYGVDALIRRGSAGNYYADILTGGDVIDRAGVWFYRWEGDGNVQAPAENAIRVLASTVLR